MKLSIEIDSIKNPVITYIEDDGTKKTTTTSMAGILKMFNESYDLIVEEKSNNTKLDEISFPETSVLPRNTVKYARRGTDTEYISVVAPEFFSTFDYYGTTFKNVAYPNLVFFFKIINNTIATKYVRCFKGRTLRDDTKLYDFPYAHVSGGRGSICFYQQDNKMTDLVELENFAHNWSHVEMGDHYYQQDKNKIGNISLRELLEKFSNKKTFDYDILKDSNYTFKTWFTELVGK